MIGKINNDPSLWDIAEVTLDATIAKLSTNSILRETCDDAAGGTICDADQVSVGTKQVGCTSADTRYIANLQGESISCVSC